LLMAALARREKCADGVGEIKFEREENKYDATVDEVFARVGARRWRLS
jgi:chorismate mutase